MKPHLINIKITTCSNLFIGGSPSAFEIGGIDLCTVTDFNGKPFIPASTLKGVLRTIIQQCTDSLAAGTEGSLNESAWQEQARQIGESYKNYLEALKQENNIRSGTTKLEGERLKKMNDRFEEEINGASAECLFGIKGFNYTPKLIFNDLIVASDEPKQGYFSIDSKNTVIVGNANVSALPRTYKAVRPDVAFTGSIQFYAMDKLDLEISVIKDFVRTALDQFNQGIYRLGNSGSRGYGKIKLEFVGESDSVD